MTWSKFECEFGKPGIIRAVKFGYWIFQMRRQRRRIEEAPVEEGDFRSNRKIERSDSSHVIGVNMHDMEITLDLLDEGVEQARSRIDVVEFDSYRDDMFGMPEQVVKDVILASFNVHFHKDGAFRGQATEGIFDGRAVVLIVAPNPLLEMGSFRAEKISVIDPRERFPQRAWSEQQNETQQLPD